MPYSTNFYDRIAALSAHLTEANEQDRRALGQLEHMLARSGISNPALGIQGKELSLERATLYAPENLSAERRKRLEQLSARVDPNQPPEFRVFRREAPLSAPSLDLTAPVWGRGAAVAESLGPFKSVDGRQFWFDFFPIIRLVPLYLAGDTQPAILFYIRQIVLQPLSPLPVHDIIPLLTRRYDIVGSSFWVRADLLAASAPAGTYVGLQIRSGHVTISPPPINVGGKLTVPAGGTCAVELAPAEPTPANPPGAAGSDAGALKIDLPDTFSFTISAGHATVTRVGNASWTLYGQANEFAWSHAASTFEPQLQSVLVPMTASPHEFGIRSIKSPFVKAEGKASIQRAGWTLPVAAIDLNNLTEAAGSGGLAVQTSEALTLTWLGLRDGPIRLPNPWVAAVPGLILITDAHASNLYAHQRFLLWKDGDSKFRSELYLRYTDSFSLTYVAAATGSELVFAATNAEARLDRPVDVKGTPLPVHTTASAMLLAYTDTQRTVFFFDDNILVDSLDPNAAWPVEPGESISLAIRNALFTITPVNSLLLFAILRDEEMLQQGSLLLGMGLYGLLPTLPDPYAANVSWLRRSIRSDLYRRQATLLLVGWVVWTKAADDDDPDTVQTGFAFAPLGTQQQAIAAWSNAAVQVHQANLVPQAASGGTQPGATGFFRGQSNEENWDRFFGAFNAEQFALLDVSTNADQMGVSFAWFDPLRLDDSNYIFYQIYKPKGEQPPPPAYPLQVRGLDLSAESRYVRAFTVPQISCDPMFNIPNPQQPPIAGDPPIGFNLYPDDGGPTRLFNDSVELVPIAPIPVTELLVEDFEQRANGFTGALFTLPYALHAFAEFSRQNQFQPGVLDPAKMSFNRPEYDAGNLRGAMQLQVDAPKHPAQSPIFKGSTLQFDNVLNPNGTPAFAGTLGSSVGFIFNKEFFYDGTTGYKDRGVPLTRIDFCGYGASTFSHWENGDAAIAETSQTFFDVFRGRTAHEVIQVRSIVYPKGFRVVRTITIFRVSSGNTYRFDTGWQPESNGVYDFRYTAYSPGPPTKVTLDSPYEIHPGVDKGVFRIRNIRETDAIPRFTRTWHKNQNETYIDDNGILQKVGAGGLDLQVVLQPVYYDADVQIDDVISGASNGRVPSRGMLGFVQLSPRGEPISKELFAELLASQLGSIGGPVDCVVNVAQSGQQMRLSRVDVSTSTDGANPIFVAAGRGAVVLPKDGAWSVVRHNQGSGVVSPLDAQATVPLIRRGKLNPATQTTDAVAGDLFRLADPIDIVRPPVASTLNYGLLQSTNTQKALFRLPSFQAGVNQLLGTAPDFADAYRIVNSKGIFPNVQDALPLNLGTFKTQILAEGYKLLDQADPAKVFEQILPPGPLYLINEDFLKIYVEYAKKDKNGTTTISDGKLRFGFDAEAADLGKKWLSKVNDIGMVVDLGSLKRMAIIKGKFDAQKGSAPRFIEPEIEFSDSLKPVVDILRILLALSTGDYKAAFEEGLKVAMSNSADSWNYAFHARQEIPVVKFPPGVLYDNPNAPFKLEAHMALGVYFNEAMAIPRSPSQLIPSAGAFVDFGGRLSVMCVSLSLATIYATGAIDLRTSGDIKTGPALYMKFGFGAEIAVGLPVIATVTLLFMVGVEINLTTTELSVAAFMLFKGRAEILGGIVTVSILIEAKGIVQRQLSPQDRTNLIAQVTFALDISIFLVINISFSESWQESRQISGDDN